MCGINIDSKQNGEKAVSMPNRSLALEGGVIEVAFGRRSGVGFDSNGNGNRKGKEEEKLTGRGPVLKRKFGKRQSDPYDRNVWGDLACLSDEIPVEALERLEVPIEVDLELEGVDEAPGIAEIQEWVMAGFGVGAEEFFSTRGARWIELARVASMALCRLWTNRTTEEIGAAHGRMHTAVCRALARFEELKGSGGEFAAAIRLVEARIGGLERVAA